MGWIPYKSKDPNYVDAAIAKPTVDVSDYVLGDDDEKWEVTEPVAPEKNLRVKKAGRRQRLLYQISCTLIRI